jgi:hypothetical protein
MSRRHAQIRNLEGEIVRLVFVDPDEDATDSDPHRTDRQSRRLTEFA